MQRFNEVYKYLKSRGAFRNQTECGKKVGYTRQTISGALHGNEDCLNTIFIKKVCYRFPEINEQWLLTGEGDMILKDVTPGQYSEQPAFAKEGLDLLGKYQTELDTIRRIILMGGEAEMQVKLIAALLHVDISKEDK